MISVFDDYDEKKKSETDRELDAINEFDKSIKCLAIELPESVWKDINNQWQRITKMLLDIQQIAKMINDTREKIDVLPDGSAFFSSSFPLPDSHWLFSKEENVPPAPFCTNFLSCERTIQEIRDAIYVAGKFALRVTTDNGKISDFDPDALLQNLALALIGINQPST